MQIIEIEMAKKHEIKLTASEISHILHLIWSNDMNCEYYGPPDQYWKRSERIKSQLKRVTRNETK